MQSKIRRNIVRGGLAAAGLAWAGAASAATVGYWRMETDNNAGASAVSVPDSSGFVGANPLTSSSATLIAQAPINPIPLTGDANTSSIDGLVNVDGSVATYSGLDATSITVEFFARTAEGAATFLNRGYSANNTGWEFRLSGSANQLVVNYVTDDGAGGGVTRNLAFTLTAPNQLSTGWRYLAFSYDEATGTGNLYAGDPTTPVATRTDVAGRALRVPTGANLSVGTAMDGGGTFQSGNGLLDEVRISNTALSPAEFLVPEPGTVGLAGVGMIGALARRRRR